MDASIKPIYNSGMTNPTWTGESSYFAGGREDTLERVRKDKKKKHKEDDVYKKGSRGQNKLFQWVTNLF